MYAVTKWKCQYDRLCEWITLNQTMESHQFTPLPRTALFFIPMGMPHHNLFPFAFTFPPVFSVFVIRHLKLPSSTNPVKLTWISQQTAADYNLNPRLAPNKVDTSLCQHNRWTCVEYAVILSKQTCNLSSQCPWPIIRSKNEPVCKFVI